MRTPFRMLTSALLAATLAAASLPAQAESPDTSNRWRLKAGGESTADGVIVVRLSEIGAVVAEIPVSVPKHTAKKGVAERIRDSLNAGLEGDRYKVEVDDGEDVIVKAREDVKDFEIAIVSNTADGIEVRLDKE